MILDIIPYQSVGPVRFGMSAQEVQDLLGKPELASTSRYGSDLLRYGDMLVTLDAGGVVEIGLVPPCQVTIAGIDIFGTPPAFNRLCLIDGAPQEYLGFIVFLRLGITLTGLHDGDKSQTAVTAFTSGRWAPMQPKLKPYNRKDQFPR